MALPSFKKLNVQGDVNFSRSQDDANQAHRVLASKAILDGLLLQGVDLVTGSANEVPHLLGRALIGWLPVRVRAGVMIWDSQDDNANPTATLSLNCSADVTVDLWVF